MNKYRYVASCNFTLYFPELSQKVLEYMEKRPDVDVIRCCTKGYKVKYFDDEIEKKSPEVAKEWRDTTHYKDFDDDATMVSVCHNCTAIFQESQPDVKVVSLWEYILENVPDFPYPDYGGVEMTLQDCWRQHDNVAEQNVVREILKKMNIKVVELEKNRQNTTYCGISTLRPAPRRNLVMAHERFVTNASEGIFKEHTPEEQRKYMEDYCNQIKTDAVVTYCHYCSQGFNLIGQKNYHLADLLFKNI